MCTYSTSVTSSPLFSFQIFIVYEADRYSKVNFIQVFYCSHNFHSWIPKPNFMLLLAQKVMWIAMVHVSTKQMWSVLNKLKYDKYKWPYIKKYYRLYSTLIWKAMPERNAYKSWTMVVVLDSRIKVSLTVTQIYFQLMSQIVTHQ